MNKRKLKIKPWVITLVAFILIIIVMTFIFRRALLVPGRPPGVDTRSFTHTAKVIADNLTKNHVIPYVDPNWYNGFEIKYAPPLIYPPIMIIYWITHNIDYAGSVIFYLIGLFSALTMFYLLRKNYSILNAFIGSIMWALSPLIFIESRTRILSIAFLPLAFYFTNRFLDKDKKYSSLIILSIIITLALLAHIMHGLGILVALLIYSFFYIAFSKTIKGNLVIPLLLMPAIVFGLSAFYLVPYILEGGAWTSISSESAVSESVNWASLWVRIVPVYFLAALYSVFVNRDAKKTALFITSCIAIFLSLGVYSPIPIVIPIFRPSSWLFFGIFGLIYLAATAVDFRHLKKWTRALFKILFILIIFIVGLYESNKFNRFLNFRNPPLLSYSQELLDKLSNGTGRIMPLNGTFRLVYWEELAEQTNLDSNEGHYYAIARNRANIAWFFDNINYGFPNLSVDYLSLQNTHYILLSPEFLDYKQAFEETPEKFDELARRIMQNAINFLDKAEQHGFKIIYQDTDKKDTGLIIYQDKSQSQYFLPVDNRVLLIGKYANTAAAVLSDNDIKSISGGSEFIDDYDLEMLKQYNKLVLYGFSYNNKKKAESLIKDYIKNGGDVFIDFWGISPGQLEDLPSFLGVTGIQKNLQSDFTLEKEGDNQAPEKFNLPNEIASSEDIMSVKETQLTEWRFMTYMGLDQAILEMTHDNEETDVIGYKEIEGNKVWFLGPNLFYHAYLTRDEKEIGFLSNLINGENPTGIQNNEKEITINEESNQPEKKSFSYQSEKEIPVLASFTYSPHWQAYVDGQKTKVYNMENMMGMVLPAGNHQVEMKYDSHIPATKFYGGLFTILTILAILIRPIVISLKRRARKKEKNG